MRICAALICGCAISLAAAGSAGADVRPTPGWLTSELRDQISDAGAQGVTVDAEQLNTECPGVQSPGVAAAGCIVAPAGCTANYIFTDGSSQYVGTARHCVDRTGQEVVMQVDTTTLAVVGTVSHMTSGEGEPGNDWALVSIDPAVAAEWGVDPAVPVIGGPSGIYTGCDVQTVKHYGHGYGVAVAQGKPEFGLATNWNSDGFGWTGYGAPGDSGSPVLLADNRAAGNFTHLIVDIGNYPGSDLAGTRITRALREFGVSLVNADGSTSRATSTAC